jgi:hypothetical protein
VNLLPRFRFGDIVNARIYNYGKKGLGARLTLNGIQSGFNAVDGYHLGRGLDYRYTYKLSDYWETGFDIRYAFSRKALNGFVNIVRNWDENRQRISLSGGSIIEQINSTEPISANINRYYALFLSQNYLRLYQKDFIRGTYALQLNAKWRLSTDLEFRSRTSLVNQEENGLFFKERRFASNGLPFMTSRQVYGSLIMRYQPFATWRRYNGSRRLSNEIGPTITGGYEQALGDNSFTKVSLQVSQSISLANWGEFNYRITAAHFIHKPSLILDYQHFKGNEINVSSGETSFLALPYYTLSNPGDHLKAFMTWKPRKFILTQNAFLSLYGLKEKVGYSYLQTIVNTQTVHYQELTYGLTGIGKILGIDLVYPMGTVVPEKLKVLVRLPF